MPDANPTPPLKSSQFRKEREGDWKDLDAIVRHAERAGLADLSAAEVMKLPRLYRAGLSSLSVARAISLDQNLIAYLESLATRAYFVVYGVRGRFWASFGRFFTHTLPRAVRGHAWQIAIAFVAMATGWAAGYWLTTANSDWYYTFVDAGLAGGRDPTATTQSLRAALFDDTPPGLESLSIFATFLFTHNSRVALFAFALGFAFGIPTILLMFTTGTMVGAFSALYASRGLGLELHGWLLIHGTTELLAVILAGAAGLKIGGAAAFPGVHGRLDAMRIAGGEAAIVAMGAVMMLFIAGGLEGFGRQLINDTQTRYVIAFVMLAVWAGYFLMAGRRHGAR